MRIHESPQGGWFFVWEALMFVARRKTSLPLDFGGIIAGFRAEDTNVTTPSEG